MKRAILISLAFFVTACASSEVVYLKNHKTGQAVKCGPYTKYGNIPAANETTLQELRYCVNDYQSQGFVRVPKP